MSEYVKSEMGNQRQYFTISSTVHLESKFSGMVFDTQPGVYDILMRCKCRDR